MPYEAILYGKEDGIAIVTLNLPEKRNAVTLQMTREIEEAFADAEEDGSIVAVILTGGTKFFTAGIDVTDILSGHGEEPTPVRMYRTHYASQAVFRRIARMSKPTIAAIAGYALGGGLELALCCDFRIAAKGARLGFPEIKLGLLPGAGGTQRISRVVGIAKAKEIVLTGEPILADEAYALGLVNKVTSEQTLLDEAKAFAKKFKVVPPFGFQVTKAILEKGLNLGLEDALELEKLGFSLLYGTEDQKEGMMAFLEKRQPLFKGE